MRLYQLPQAMEYYLNQGWHLIRLRVRHQPPRDWYQGRWPDLDPRMVQLIASLPIVLDLQLPPEEFVIDAVPVEGYYEHRLSQAAAATRAQLRASRNPPITTYQGTAAREALKQGVERSERLLRWMEEL